MSESVRERTCNLDGIAAKLYKDEDVAETMGLLFSELQERRDHLSPESWKQLSTMNCRPHPLLELLHQDPLSSRAFLKPRGYAGDADMLDLLYAIEDGETLPALQRSSELGRRIYHATANLAAARAVRSRRWIIIDTLNELTARIAGPHVLSLACGHMREPRHGSALLQGRFGRLWAAAQGRGRLRVV